jgi:hypothetical protein
MDEKGFMIRVSKKRKRVFSRSAYESKGNTSKMAIESGLQQLVAFVLMGWRYLQVLFIWQKQALFKAHRLKILILKNIPTSLHL